jgi:hypothetical protein
LWIPPFRGPPRLRGSALRKGSPILPKGDKSKVVLARCAMREERIICDYAGLTPAMGRIVKRVRKSCLFIKGFFSLFSSFSLTFCR